MDSLSPGIKALIEEASEWATPHNFDNIKPAEGNIAESKNIQYLQPNVDLFPFYEFIARNTNGSFKYNVEPIKKPLFSKLPTGYAAEALDLFKITLLLTNEDNMSQKHRHLLGDYISCRSISCRELRDEIILQILCQTCERSSASHSPLVPSPPPPPPGTSSSAQNGVSITGSYSVDDKAWHLLVDCLSCFKPSFKFQNYILSYLINGRGNGYEILCMEKLQQNSSTDEEFQRCYPPCLLEKYANRDHSAMALKCSFSDESSGCGKVTSWTTAEDFASSVLKYAKNLLSSHAMGWTVALKDLHGIFECQSGDFVLDLISEIEVPPNFGSQLANFLVTKLSHVAEHSHGIQSLHDAQKKRLLEYGEHLGACMTHKKSFQNKQNFQSRIYQGTKFGERDRDDASRNGSVRSSLTTKWIDAVFQGVLSNEANPSEDASYIASKIKGGNDDQPNPGMPVMMPQVLAQHPYMGQPLVPMVVPNPQMMYQPGTMNPAMYQPPMAHQVDQLYLHLNPERRKETYDLRAQLEAKELERKVLETTLKSEVLKQQIQELKSFSAPQQRQNVFMPYYQYPQQQQLMPQEQQQRQSRPQPPPLLPKTGSISKGSSKSNHVTFASLPVSDLKASKQMDKDHSDENEGSFQCNSATDDTFRKIGKLGKIVWPPQGLEKTKYNPRKLMIDKKNVDEDNRIEDAPRMSKIPPKPPIKSKPSLSRTDGKDLKKVVSGSSAAQEPEPSTSINLKGVRMKLEEIFSRGSCSKESETPPVRDSDFTGVQVSEDKTSKVPKKVLQPESQRQILTYAGVGWELEIRKEYFSPQEKLKDNVAVDLIYRQVVRDGFSDNCARLTTKCCKELRDVFGKLQIVSPNGKTSNEMKLLVIEVAKKLPFYFSKIYPVCLLPYKDEGVHQVAVGCEGISLLTFTDDLTFNVFKFIRFEEITKVELTSKTNIAIECGGDCYIFYSPKAVEMQNLIEAHKKEKLELQSKLDDYMSSHYDKMIDTSFSQISGESPSAVPKPQSNDDGVIVKVHAGSRSLLVEILPEMDVVEVIMFVCRILGITLTEVQLEFVLRFEQGQMWTCLMNKINAFSSAMKVFNVPQEKVGTSEVVGEVNFLRGAWIAIVDLSKSPSTYLDVLYNQSILDYLCGYYLPSTSNIVPAAVLEEISLLVALQFQIEHPNSVVFEEGVEKYLPRHIWHMVDLDYLNPLILNQCNAIQKLRLEDKKIVALEILSKWPMFGSSFFQVTLSRDTTRNQCILAVHKHGIYLLNPNTNVVMSFFSYKRGVSITIDSSQSSLNMTLWVGGDSSSDGPSSFSVASREREQILGLVELYNSLLR